MTNFEVSDQIGIFTIQRTKALNALNNDVFSDLKEMIDKVNEHNIKGLIITGEGEKAFAAGADITEFNSLDEESAKALSASGQKIFKALENSKIPVVAAVNGFALGGGLELAMACHLRIASNNARFGLPEANLGILPGYGGTVRLAELVGKGRALEIILTTRIFGSEEALKIGLISDVTTADELIPTCKKLISTIASKGPLAVANILNQNYSILDRESRFRRESEYFGELATTDDFKEGVKAFLNKRKPDFKGK